MKRFLFILLFLFPAYAFCDESFLNAENTSHITAIKWSVVGLCFLIAILRQITSIAIDGTMSLPWTHVLARLVCVVFFIHYAGQIQGFMSASGKSIGDSYLAGNTIQDVNNALSNRIKQQKENRDVKEDKSGSIFNGALFNESIAANLFMRFMEHASVTLFFLLYKFLISAQNCIMLFLGAMAPILIPPSIIPGVNTWSSWLKMVASTALWPVVAGFMIKGHFMTSSALIADPSHVFSHDVSNMFINMDALGLLSEALIYAFLILSSPAIAASIVYGSAHVLASGAGYMMTAGAASIPSSASRMSQKIGAKK